jgi:hypothetical protein
LYSVTTGKPQKKEKTEKKWQGSIHSLYLQHTMLRYPLRVSVGIVLRIDPDTI